MANRKGRKAAVHSPETAPAKRPPVASMSSEEDDTSVSDVQPDPNEDHSNGTGDDTFIVVESDREGEKHNLRNRKRKRSSIKQPSRTTAPAIRPTRKRQKAVSAEVVLARASKALENARQSGNNRQTRSAGIVPIDGHTENEKEQSRSSRSQPAAKRKTRTSNRLRKESPEGQPDDAIDNEDNEENENDADEYEEGGVPALEETSEGENPENSAPVDETAEETDEVEEVAQADIMMTEEDKQTIGLDSQTAREITELMSSIGWSGKRTWKVAFRQLQANPQSGLQPVTAQGKELRKQLAELAAMYAKTPQPVFPSERFFQPLAQYAYLLVRTEKLRQLRDGIQQRIINACDISLAPVADDMTSRERRMRALLCEDLATFVVPEAAALLETTLMLGGRDDDDDICLDGFYVPLAVCQLNRGSLEIAAQASSWLARLEAALAHELGYRAEYGDQDSSGDENQDQARDGDDVGRQRQRSRLSAKKEARRRLHLLVNRVQDEIWTAKIELERKIRLGDMQLLRTARLKEVEQQEAAEAAKAAAAALIEFRDMQPASRVASSRQTPTRPIDDDDDEVRHDAHENMAVQRVGRLATPPCLYSDGYDQQSTMIVSPTEPVAVSIERQAEPAMQLQTQPTPTRPTQTQPVSPRPSPPQTAQTQPTQTQRVLSRPSPQTQAQTQLQTDMSGKTFSAEERKQILKHLMRRKEPNLVRLAAELGRDLMDVAHQAEIIKSAARTMAAKKQKAIPQWAGAGCRLPGYSGL